jgi:hypothetical protein
MAFKHTALLCAVLALGCGADDPPPSPPCEQECQDGTAVRGIREMMKVAYNLSLFGNDVGPQDETVPCTQGGQVRVFGEASSNALQGATMVDLTYAFQACSHVERDDEAPENYELTLDGQVTQLGTIAVQPSATTALVMGSDSVTLVGTVYDPPIDYRVEGCAVTLGQNGNDLSGRICGRIAGADL